MPDDVVTVPRRGRSTGRPRLADVARLAGVAKITASRVLRSPAKVAPETRRRIEQAMMRLGYVPNIVASSLSSNRTAIFAAIVPSFVSPLIRDLLQGLSDTVRPHGLQLLFGASGVAEAEEELLIRAMLARRPEAIVLSNCRHTPAARKLLAASGIPVVEVGERAARPVDMAVGFSNERAARRLTQHLFEQGYRCIGLIIEPDSISDRSPARRRGFARAHRDAGLKTSAARIVQADASIADGAAAFGRLLQAEPHIDAVVCTTDVFAVGAMQACRRARIAVPRRMGIAGFDGTEFAPALSPSLTTLGIDRHRMGVLAGEMLLQRLAGGRPAQPVADVAVDVVPRESTARAHKPDSSSVASCRDAM